MTEYEQKEMTMDERKIKCVVWDLDNTLWNGTLLEGDDVHIDDQVRNVLETLDNRGILQSVASKNEYDLTMSKLHELGLGDYFLYPQINWNPKSESVGAIAESINIGVDTLAFIDDQAFEREEVNFSVPDVMCIDAAQIGDILDMPEMNPRFITDESIIRREMYRSDIQRKNIEEDFAGPQEKFLASLDMVFKIGLAKEEDLQRAEELTVRTHQLNTTGYTYSYDELNEFRQSGRHILLVASLDDKYGTYGKIGLTLIECDDTEKIWNIRLLLMSCRVMARGVGSILINHIRSLAREKGVRLRAELVPNDRNRMMYMAYKFANFKEIEKSDDLVIFENDLTDIQDVPEYVTLKTN